jgi:anaerobic ribonucleoside-triphosphate reductase activating protein
MENPSLCDGIGYRTVLFLQGCNLRCKGCQNKSTWDIEKGVLIDVKELAKDFDLCLYTGHELKDVPEDILSFLKYIKYGPFIEELKTTMKPFVGSTNQEFMEVSKNEKTK